MFVLGLLLLAPLVLGIFDIKIGRIIFPNIIDMTGGAGVTGFVPRIEGTCLAVGALFTLIVIIQGLVAIMGGKKHNFLLSAILGFVAFIGAFIAKVIVTNVPTDQFIHQYPYLIIAGISFIITVIAAVYRFRSAEKEIEEEVDDEHKLR